MKIHQWLLWIAQDLGIMVSYDPDSEDKGAFYPDMWMIHINCLNPEVLAHELGHAYLYKYVEGEAYQSEAMAWAVAEMLWTIHQPLSEEWAKYSQFK